MHPHDARDLARPTIHHIFSQLLESVHLLSHLPHAIAIDFLLKTLASPPIQDYIVQATLSITPRPDLYLEKDPQNAP